MTVDTIKTNVQNMHWVEPHRNGKYNDDILRKMGKVSCIHSCEKSIYLKGQKWDYLNQ